MPFRHLKITCEGLVAMCCDQPPGILGNVLETSIDEILNSARIQEIKEATTSGKLHADCGRMYCCYKYVNPEDYIKEITHYGIPTDLEIDLPNFHCNVNPGCIMCFRASPYYRRETDRLSEVCQAISHLLNHLLLLHIQGIAEPFYQDKIFEVLDWLDYDKYKIINRHIVVSTISNGMLFSAKTCQKMIDRCPNFRIMFSIDAGTPETYEKIRRFDVFHVVKNNLIQYNKMRNRNCHKFVINNNINILNLHEVEEMVQYAADVGVDMLQFDPTSPVCDVEIDDEIIPDITVNSTNYTLFEEAQEKIIQEAQRLGVKVSFRKPLCLNFGKTVKEN